MVQAEINMDYDIAGSLWDVLSGTFPDEVFADHGFSQTVPARGGCTADSVGDWHLLGE